MFSTLKEHDAEIVIALTMAVLIVVAAIAMIDSFYHDRHISGRFQLGLVERPLPSDQQ